MNVLIVDDSCSARKLLRITFEHYNCAVVEAFDGQDGLEQATRHKPDIIISDALMPRMDGFQLLRALKATPELASIPFIFYSATYTGEQESKLAFSLGAEAFVPKPVEPELLWQKTCAVMQSWQERQLTPRQQPAGESNEQYLSDYSRIVATKLEEKVRELEEALLLREKAEEELRTVNAGLEERIAREVEKNREKDHIMAHQARLAAMGEMLSNIAHQWRQPLNNISLIVQNLYLEFSDGTLDNETFSANVAECMKHLSYMSRTIDNFRAFYHPDQNRQLFSLCSVTTDTIALVREDLEAHGINIQAAAECGAQVNGFRNEFTQVLLNIIVNAKEALLTRQTPSPCIRITCVQHAGKALVTITDNGGGIAPDIMERIFDPYFTTHFMSPGAGMGLYIAKVIIEKHMQGSISIRTTATDTEVSIELPCTELSGQPAGETDQAIPGRNERLA